MTKLIKNELFKIFHKKSAIVLLIIFIIYVGLTNIIRKNIDINSDFTTYYFDSNLNELEKDLQKLNPANPNDTEQYIYTKSQIDSIKLANKYGDSTWQAHEIATKVNELYININNMMLNTPESADLDSLQEELDNIIYRFDHDDWQSFIKEDIESLNETNQKLNNQLLLVGDSQKKDIQNELKRNEIAISALNHRLNYNLPYGGGELNGLLENLTNLKYNIIELESSEISDEDRQEYEKLKAEAALLEYQLQNPDEMISYKSSRGIIYDFYSEYTLLIIVLILIVGGGIVSDEFSKGTIKNLLIKPYTRINIIFSKIISAIIVLLLGIGVILTMQVIVGGIFFNVKTLSIPVSVYNYTTCSVKTIGLIKYFLTQTITILPMFILLLFLAITISTITNSTSSATAITIFAYLGSQIINNLAIIYNLKILKFFPTLHWDMRYYLYGGFPDFKYASLGLSLFCNALYLSILLFITCLVFKKRDIKNI